MSKKREATAQFNPEISAALKLKVKLDAVKLGVKLHEYTAAALSLFLDNPEKEKILSSLNSSASGQEKYADVIGEHLKPTKPVVSRPSSGSAKRALKTQ